MLYGGQLEPQGFSFFTEVKISTTVLKKNAHGSVHTRSWSATGLFKASHFLKYIFEINN